MRRSGARVVRVGRVVGGCEVALAMLLACAPQGTSAPTSTPEPVAPTPDEPAAVAPAAPAGGGATTRAASLDATHMLLGDPRLAIDEAVIARWGAVRLVVDGDVVAQGEGAKGWQRVRVADRGDGKRVRVVMSFAKATMLLWIDVADLGPQIVRTTTLRTSRGETVGDRDGRIELAPGEIVTIDQRGGGWSSVKTEGGLSGWVADTDLGPIFRAQPFASQSSFDALLREGADLHVRPKGKAMHRPAKLVGVSYHDPSAHPRRIDVHLVRTDDDWHEIEYMDPCRPTMRVRGWAKQQDVEVVGPMAGGVSCGSRVTKIQGTLGDLADAPKEPVAAGTELVDEKGELVGRIDADTELVHLPEGGFGLASPWGAMTVRVAVPKSE